jgi:hypothetical protein
MIRDLTVTSTPSGISSSSIFWTSNIWIVNQVRICAKSAQATRVLPISLLLETEQIGRGMNEGEVLAATRGDP